MKDYKETLLIKETKFEMRGDLVKKDPSFLLFWEKNNVYKKLSNRVGKEFILHDGPPYANGDLHVGHALNKILKDIIIRQNALLGNKINWLLGWDTHGLPIENQIQKNGIKISEVGLDKYLNEAKNYALSQVEKQNEQFKKFALLTDFKNRYQTLDSKFEEKEIEIFHSMLNKKLVYQDLKPVYWSWSSETALAEAEIEYKDLESNAIYVTFKHENEDISFMIYTTTPWTLAANTAIAFGEKIKYSLVKINNKNIVIATNLIKIVQEKVNNLKIISDNFDVKKLIGSFAINPTNNSKSILVYGHHVTTEMGTGIVHIAGGHGIDDYLISKENNLDLIVAMDDQGHLQNWGHLNGVFYLKAESQIIEELKDNCLHHEKIKHSVAIDWRTKKPIVYRATKQWFFSISKIKKDLLKSIQKVNWLPSWGQERMSKMTEDRDEWCISRQRAWGVPIPIIYDENNVPIVDKNLQKNIQQLFKTKGSTGWFNAKIKDLLPSNIKFNSKMRKEKDILDVWFDSGSSHLSVIGKKQADLYIEGIDQYRGWFNSSLVTSQVINGRAPYKNVISHGFTIDEQGNKMSKSIGNVIDPLEVVNKNGADILRMWVASSDYTDAIKISPAILEQVINDYRKIRNTIKFILSNLVDYDNSKFTKLSYINQTVYSDVSSAWFEIQNSYKEFSFLKVIKKIMSLITNGSISYYLDFSKDILYIEKEKSKQRREVQFVLKSILDLLLYSLGPIIPVTIEEAYQTTGKKLNSFFLNKQPKFKKIENTSWVLFDELKSVVNKQLEESRNKKIIKRSQEAEVILHLPKKSYDLYKNENLRQLFLVGKMKISIGKLKATVKQFNSVKCQRCWNSIEKKEMHDDEICKRCNVILT